MLAWWRTGVSWCGGLSGAARAAPGPPADDLADRGGGEAAVFDVAPAVDFAKHRAELGVGDLQPVTQRLDRTAAAVGVTGDGAAENLIPSLASLASLGPFHRCRRIDAPFGLAASRSLGRAIEGQFSRGGGEADMFGIEAHQSRGAAAAGGHQEQQCAIAHPAQVAATGSGQAHQLGWRWRRRMARGGGAPRGAQNGFDRPIGRWRGEAARAVLGGNRAGAPGQGAGAEAGCGLGQKRSHSRRIGRQRGPPHGGTPSLEGRPVPGVKPQRLGARPPYG